MKYSEEFKEQMVKKILTGKRICDLSKETEIPLGTLHSWKNKINGKIYSPNNNSLQKKYTLLLESKKLNKNDLGEWLRKNGVHSDHLIKWESEISEAMTNNKYKEENKKLKNKLKVSEREILKKDKALAEAAALLVLKKKYQHLWEDEVA